MRSSARKEGGGNEAGGNVNSNGVATWATPKDGASGFDDHEKKDKDEKEEKEPAPPKVSILGLFRYADKLDVTLLIVGSLVAIATGTGFPLLSIIIGNVSNTFVEAATALGDGTDSPGLNGTDRQVAIDHFNEQVIKSVLQYVYVGAAVFATATIQVMCWLVACERMADRLRRNFVRSVLRQDVAWFDKNASGTLASKLFDQLERVREGTGDKVALLLQYVSQFFAGFGVAFAYDWRLTLIMMSLSPFMIICGAFIARLMASASAEEAKKYAVAGGIAEEVLSSIRTVHAFNAQPHEVARYEKALVAGKIDGIKKSFYVGAGLALTFLIIFSSYCLAFWVGTDYIYWGWLRVDTVLTVFFSVMMGSMALGQAGPQYAVIGTAQGAAAALYEVIDREPEIDSYSSEGARPAKVHGHIQFKNVRFTYPNREEVEVLKGINLECHPGQTIALVGSSGCGKSTSISLMLRYYDPTHGQVLLDGLDIRDANVGWLRQTVGVVSQEPILFDTSIEENIRFGRSDVTAAEIDDALKKANAYDFVQTLPDGLATNVGTRGTQLSGGQKQRIAIARALVRNPRVLLLDEATSALDATSEKIVQQALENASRGRSTIVVAHRLSTIRNAHRIVVFKQGEVVEEGTHDELLALEGHYHALVHSQVFTDIDDDAAGSPIKMRRQSSQTPQSPKSPREDAVAASTKSARKYESAEEASKAKNELERLKKELEEEGVSRVGLLGIAAAAKPEWCFILIALLSSGIQGCVFPAFSFFFTEILNIFATPDKEKLRSDGHFWSLMFLVLGAVNAVTMMTQCVLFGVSAERLTMRLRLNVFRNLLSMDMAYMDDPRHAPGKLCTRLATDAPTVKSAIDYRLGSVIGSVVAIGCGLGIAFYYGWEMALLMIAIFPLAGVGQAIQIKYIESRSKSDNANLENAGKISTEAMENIRTVQALTLESDVISRFCAQLDGPLRTATRRAIMQGLSYGFSTSIFFFLYAAAFRFGAWLIVINKLLPMHVLKVLFAISFTAGSAGMASSYFPEYVKATFAAGLIFKMLRMQTRIDGSAEASGTRKRLDGAVELQDVFFTYEQRAEQQVLSGFSLRVQPGKKIALVGPSGCGKSTIVSLLQRFYDVNKGNVLLDGVEIRSRCLHDIRRQMGVVSQEPILFDLSIRENIAYGMEGDTDFAAIERVSLMANAHNFISALPAGYETRVGEKGTQLSGGQKQRIAIARALLRDPRILLLDEATSALDMESEKIVQEALDEAQAGRTCLIVAHRLATVVNADLIVVVNDGVVVEQGTHDDLMAAKGAYYKLTQQQTSQKH